MGVVTHLRDKHLPSQPLHFESRKEGLRLTDDPERVTCKRCLAMMKRKANFDKRRKDG